MAESSGIGRPSQVTWKTAFVFWFAALAVAGLAYFLWRTRIALMLTLLAGLLAIALDHGAVMLQRKRVARGWAVVMVMVALLFVVALAGILIVPPAAAQGRQLVEEAPALIQKLRQVHFIRLLMERFAIPENAEQLRARTTELASGALPPLLSAIGGALSIVAGLITMLFLVAFLLIFGRGVLDAFLSESLPPNRERYEHVLSSIYRSIGGYISGVSLICTTNAVLTTTFLAITHTPFFLPLGILSGMSSLVPYAGATVAGAAITMVALITGGPFKALITLIYFVLYGQLEGNVLAPLVFRRTAHVNPLLTLLSILFLAEMAGIAGAVLAVPILSSGQIVIRELLILRRERMLSAGPTG